jgi:hypothetical protein
MSIICISTRVGSKIISTMHTPVHYKGVVVHCTVWYRGQFALQFDFDSAVHGSLKSQGEDQGPLYVLAPMFSA